MKHITTYIVCVAAFMILFGCEEQKKSQSKKPAVVLTLRTIPKEASVLVDGKRLEQTTPLQHDFGDNLEHMVEIQAKGFESKWIRIPPSPPGEDTPYDMGEIKLTPLRVPLILRSVPLGARVSMDGDDLGKTPVYVKSAPPGPHDLVFMFAGHAKMHKHIELKEGDLKNIVVSLESITGTLTVLTKPTGADIFVQGDPKGPSNVDGRLVIDNVPEGVITIEVRKDGYKPRKLTVDLKANESKLVTVPQLEPKPGNLKIESKPEGAKIYWDGLLVGTTPHILKDLKPEQHKIKVSLENYDDKTKIVQVIPNMTKTTVFVLDAKFGTLTVVSQPSECTIIVDGSTKGKTEPGDAPGTSKPFEIDGLSPGPHDLVFEKAGFDSVKKRVLVERGKNTRIPPVKLLKLWLPTHILRIKGEMNSKKVRLLSDNGDSIDVEYQKGKITMRVLREKVEQFDPIK